MKTPSLPSSEPNPPAPTGLRKRSTLVIILVALIVSAILILVLPLRLPWPARLAVAGGDLIAAIMIAFVLRQEARR